MQLTIRPLRTDDMPSIVSVVNDWWGGRSVAHLLPRLFFEHFTTTSFVAEVDGRLAGFLVGFVSPARAGEAYVHFVGVDPVLRRGGVARALYERFFRCVRDQGCRCVRCITSPVNKTSVAFHRRMGFVIEPGDGEVDGLAVCLEHEGPGAPRVRFVRLLDEVGDAPVSRDRAS